MPQLRLNERMLLRGRGIAVRFDEFPADVPFADNDDALAGAAALDDGRDETLHAYGGRLTSGTSHESGLVETLVAIEGLICQFMLGQGDARSRHGSALTPWMEMGGQVSPPPVHAFPESSRPFLTERATKARRADVRARIHDFRWERWRDVTGARGAIDSYLEATQDIDLMDDGATYAAMEHLIRAAEVSMAISYRRDEVRGLIASEIRRSVAGSHLGYPCWLLERAAELLAQDRALALELAEKSAHAATEAGARHDRHSEQSYLEAAIAVVAAAGRHDQAKALRGSKAASLEAEAMDRAVEGGLIESTLLTEAAEAYSNLGDSASVQRIKTRLPQANRRAMDEMQTIGAEMSVPDSAIDDAVSSLSAATSTDPVAIRAFPRQWGFWPSWASVEQQRRDNQSVFLNLVTTTFIEHDARSVQLPDDQVAREAALAVHAFAQRTAMTVGLAEIALRRLRESANWTSESVSAAINTADSELGRACESGVRAFESGDWWTALHVLAPQVERAVRLVGVRNDARVHRITSAQRLMWANLGPMLEDPDVRAALTGDLANELQALFTSDYGPNIRNNVAHGAADLDGAKAPAVICLMAVLTIAEVLVGLPEPGHG